MIDAAVDIATPFIQGRDSFGNMVEDLRCPIRIENQRFFERFKDGSGMGWVPRSDTRYIYIYIFS